MKEEENSPNKPKLYSWKTLFIGLVIGLGLAILIYLFYVSINLGKDKTTDGEIRFENQVLNSCLDNCKKCTQNCKDNYYFENSKSQEDESLCKNIQNELLRGECQNNFIFNHAVKNLNLEECNNIDDEIRKNSCIYTVVVNKAVQTENLAECESLEQNLIQNCKDNSNYQLAIKKNSQLYCEQITLEEMKKECISLTSGLS